MLVTKIMTAAFAHTMEEPDHDIVTRNLTVPLVNMGVAELTHAENVFRTQRAQDGETTTLLTEPVTVEKPEDDVPYDYHITTILLPLWLAWKIFEGLDDDARANNYRALYDEAYDRWVPALWEQMEDHNGVWGCFCVE